MTKQEQVQIELKMNGPMTASQLAKKLGISIKAAYQALYRLKQLGRVHPCGWEKFDKRNHEKLYKTGYVQKVRPRFVKVVIPDNKEPYSKNEDYYGSDYSKRWTWQDVKSEAELIQYQPNNYLNNLPYETQH